MMKKMKNNNINKTGLIIGAFCLIMVSCKAPSLTPTEKIELPEFYMDRETDSTTISSMSWKTLFPDTLLQSYIAEALNNNHSFLQTIERISIARSQVRVGKGALLPDLSLGIDGGVQRFGEYTMDGVGNSTTNTPDLEKDKHIPDPYRNFNLGLNFQWEADIWGKLTDKKRSTVSRWMQSVEAMRLARTLLISEVGTHYFELIGLDKQRYVLREAILTARDAYNLTDELMKEGEVTYVINYQQMADFYDTNDAHQKLGRRIAETLLWEVYDRMISMYSLTPEERYLEIINRCPDLLKLITLKELASYLLIRPETLSRIRRKVVQK